jgi:hypothetical protein
MTSDKAAMTSDKAAMTSDEERARARAEHLEKFFSKPWSERLAEVQLSAKELGEYILYHTPSL